MHYLELDDNGRLVGIRPLTEEIAGTEFYDGILLPVPEGGSATFAADLLSFLKKEADLSEEGCAFRWMRDSDWWDAVAEGAPVSLFLLNRIALPASELGADNGGGDCHVQRL